MNKTEIVVNATVHKHERAQSGQVKRHVIFHGRILRMNAWTVALYAFLTVAGILLYKAGAAYALRERGYYAVGVEAMALLLPGLHYATVSIIGDIIKGWRKKH